MKASDTFRIEPLDRYLREQASQDIKRRIGGWSRRSPRNGFGNLLAGLLYLTRTKVWGRISRRPDL